ncbi:hypothetical protein NIES4071_106600 (plasmid) [Calothrix sp. NIES-4071]|nr:hypothetical protein NIES4071_106600 [Calothrix sp. NIES-4071]BAZ65078.1 hypothetical protein NIES4105_108110 [Calothrix sp. NIES-4105]
MSHNLFKTQNGWTCSVCGWEWKSKPSTECPSVPRYHWWNQNEQLTRMVPDHFKTKTQLASLKLAPLDEDKPDGCIYMQAQTRWLSLYDINKTAPLPKKKRSYKSAEERRITKEALLLWDSGDIYTEVYKDIEISAYASYRDCGFKRPSQLSKKRKPYFHGFLSEVILTGLPMIPFNSEVKAILNRSVVNHIKAIVHRKILIDKLFDIGISNENCERLEQFGSGFIMTDSAGYGFCLRRPDGTTLARRLASQFGWEVIEE